ncbi:MAG: 3-deoxy-7-phosphoheptulonate synthase [Spirochaetaceae bacterium]|jgi:3-deoxy-7-phosphoheptulonate synthase|nr:3-deoxy-7-phosphoheptulonate synthase [Spirochaetaceae bacterium]
MILVLKPRAPQDGVDGLVKNLENRGFTVHRSDGACHTILGLVGDTSALNEETFRANPLVDTVMRVSSPYKLASRAFHPDKTRVSVGQGKAVFGGGGVTVIAGPCSVESPGQITLIAGEVKRSGARLLRGGAFKPRTSPYAFQGLGPAGLELLSAAKKAVGLPLVSELMNIQQLEHFGDVDVIQIGARNMQNFDLLKELGGIRKPVLLKRGLASTVKELLMSAEYVLAAGNSEVILCERGVRGFDQYTRNILDLSAVPWLQRETHLPVIVDPSHASGASWMVPALAKAALAAGADGLMIEVHNDPEKALCDGEQSMTCGAFDSLMGDLARYAQVEGKTL